MTHIAYRIGGSVNIEGVATDMSIHIRVNRIHVTVDTSHAGACAAVVEVPESAGASAVMALAPESAGACAVVAEVPDCAGTIA